MAVALVAVIAGLAVGGTVVRIALLAYARHATGLHIDAARIERHGGAYVVDGLTASTPDGAVSVAARSARVTTGGKVTILLEAPHVSVDASRIRGDERFHWNAQTAVVRVRDGTLAVANGTGREPALAFEEFRGKAVVAARRVSYDASLTLVSAGQTFPLTGHAATTGDGTTHHYWTAPLLPVAPLATLIGTDGAVEARDGSLHDVAIDASATVHASARLDGVDAVFADHKLHGIHGTLVTSGDGVGSRDLAGTVDNAVPFDAAGEVHDVDGWFGWLRGGSRDLTALGTLFSSFAKEPRLQSMRVEATAPGLMFGQYAMTGDHGPVAVSVLALDPRETTLRIDTAIAQDHVFSGGERTSALSVRTGAVGAVNGDYFDIGRTYQPQGMLLRNGELVRGPTDRAALVIDAAKHVTIAEFRLHGQVRTPEGVMPVTEFNDWPPGHVAVITPAFGKELPAASGHTFVALESVGGKRYRVTAVTKLDTAIPVRFGIAIGPLVRTPLPHRGEVLTLDYALDPPVDGAVAGIGGGPILLRGGQWFEDPHAPAPDERNFRWPVIALARDSDDRLLLVAVDGRHPERSVGMTRPEFAELLQRFGGIDAMALDSGGSVTLVSRAPGDRNASVRNVPSDNSAERWISDALLIYSSAPEQTIVPVANAPTPIPEARPAP